MIILTNAFSLQMLDLTGQNNISINSITADDVQNMLANHFVSAVGHADTANVLSNMLNINVSCNRINVRLDADTVLIVAQLTGGRLPEGATTLPDGFKFQFVMVQLM